MVHVPRKNGGRTKRSIDAYQKLLESADVHKMLERMEAYKKIVEQISDQEKEALRRDFETKLAEREKAEGRVIGTAVDIMRTQASNLFGIVAVLMPHVPPERRKPAIDASNLSENVKRMITELAVEAPYLPPAVSQNFDELLHAALTANAALTPLPLRAGK